MRRSATIRDPSNVIDARHEKSYTRERLAIDIDSASLEAVVLKRLQSISEAAAQQALPADAATRRARSERFWLLVSARLRSRSISAAQLKRKTLGASRFAHLSRSRITLFGAPAENCTTATTERIGREMKARYAAWFRVTLSQPRVVRAPVVLK